MNSKEILVFIIGIILIGFLYQMKHPQVVESPQSNSHSSKTLGIDLSSSEKMNKFNPDTEHPTLEDILDIPAWSFDFEKLAIQTNEELTLKTKEAINKGDFFEPENNNALFFLLNLKQLFPDNLEIKNITQTLNQQLIQQAQISIQNNKHKELRQVIARLKSLDNTNPTIKTYQAKLAAIKTINKLYTQGIQQISNNLIVKEDSKDAWHTAKKCLKIDRDNIKTKQLVTKVNNILISNALRAAEEIDFFMAQNQLNQASSLSPLSEDVANAQLQISQLKQQRYIWLEQQLSLAINNVNLNRAQKMILQLADIGIEQSQLIEYQNEIDRITIFGQYQPLQIFFDTKNNIDFPKMVVMPIGNFIMGSTTGAKHERPAHRVAIQYGFAISQNEISVLDFKKFIKATAYKTDAEQRNTSRIYDLKTGRLKNKYRINWRKNYIGKKAKDSDPVIHVSWNDVEAYVNWLSKQTGKKYRLPSESEFEYVLKAGSSNYYPWGNGSPKQVIENITGQLDKSKQNTRMSWQKGFENYNDGYWGPAPVGSFITNQFKLNDTAGNVMEWVADCWHDSYARAPIDGSAWINSGCKDHIIRGGSWSSAKNEFISSHRFKAKKTFTDARLGFRIAVDLK